MGPPTVSLFRVIALLDMDCFFAAVEQRDHPSYRGKPVIVGSPPDQRGVVCAASYEARKFGVRSAIPSATAQRLCPAGIFLRPRMEVYRAESQRIMQLVAQTGALVEQVSVDEAYLDWSAFCQSSTPDDSLQLALALARQLKDRIREECRLTASVGLAANKFLAKLASDQQKPDGLTIIQETTKVQFLRTLPVGVLPGVGKVTEHQLKEAGLSTVGDVQDFAGDLRPLVGSFARDLKAFASGRDDRPLDLSNEVKSISSENTFRLDTSDRILLRRTLRGQAQELAGDLFRHGLAAKTVEVRVRYGDFTTLSRQLTLDEPTADPGALYRLGCHLLGRHRLVHRPLRLLGLRVSHLVPPVRQLLLPLN